VTLAVREQHMDKIRAIALDVSNPDSPDYGQYLSQARVDEITAPAAVDVTAVRSWLSSWTGTTAEANGGRLFVLTAPATAMGSLLKTQFRRVTNAATGQTTLRAASFTLPTAAAAAVAAVFGVHGLPLPPKHNPRSQESSDRFPTSAKVTPTVITSTYNVAGVVVDRSGKNRQAVAEFQGQSMNSTDLATFFKNEVPEAQAGDDVVSKFVGSTGAEGPGKVEASLDIQYIMGVAPGIKTEFWYYSSMDFCGDVKTWSDAILATQDVPLVHSVSYGGQGNLTGAAGCGGDIIANIDANFAKLAVRGITIIFASGDFGSGYTTENCHFHPGFKTNTSHVGTVAGRHSAQSAVECCEFSGEAYFTFKEPESKTCVPSENLVTGEGPTHPGYFKLSECCDAAQNEGAGYIYDANKRLCTVLFTVTGSTGNKPPAGIVSGHTTPGSCTWYSAINGTVSAPGFTSGGSAFGILYPSWPASSPWVTAVGATRFAGAKVGNEEVASNQFGSGGGFSAEFAQSPDATWQSAMVAAYLKGAPQLPPANLFNPLGRATPDVSALGEGYAVYAYGVDGKPGLLYPGPVGGTSASTPAFAALVSLLNEKRLQANMPPMGFLNPFLYKNADAFTDVVKGTNALGRGTGPLKYGYNCTKGWDPVTGLGTPKFGKLLAAAMAAVEDPASIAR